MDELIQLPGVGRKTANCVLSGAFNITSGIVVDTHVARLSKRLGLTKNTDPGKIESDLCEVIERKDWIHFGNALIQHGRTTCGARKPQCDICPLILCAHRQRPKAGEGYQIFEHPHKDEERMFCRNK